MTFDLKSEIARMNPVVEQALRSGVEIGKREQTALGAEIDKLRRVNAALTEALEGITDAYEGRMTDTENAEFYEVYNDARSALALSKEAK